MSLYIGTSGWSYPEWKPAFYPEKLPAKRFLEHYTRELTSCEINATFYRMQSESTFQSWAAAAPAGFRYAVKAHRGITHEKEIAPDADFLAGFLRTLSPLGDRLGAVLFQLPPFRKRDDAGLSRLLERVPRAWPAAYEFRNASWDHADVRARIVEAGGTLCFAETEGQVPEALPPGRIAYVRLRAERYDEARRAAWLALLRREAQARDVYVYAKHEGVPAGDPFGGVGLAQWLMAEVRRGG